MYGCDIPNDSSFALFLDNRGFVGSHEVKMKTWRFYSYGYFVDKNHRFHLPAKQCVVRQLS